MKHHGSLLGSMLLLIPVLVAGAPAQDGAGRSQPEVAGNASTPQVEGSGDLKDLVSKRLRIRVQPNPGETTPPCDQQLVLPAGQDLASSQLRKFLEQLNRALLVDIESTLTLFSGLDGDGVRAAIKTLANSQRKLPLLDQIREREQLLNEILGLAVEHR